MDIRSFLEPNRKKPKRSKLLSTLKIFTFLLLLILGGIGFKGTFAIYSTLAKTPVAEASTVMDILEVNGEFDASSWLDRGASGIEISNITNAKVWVYFNIEGELIQAIQHIDAVSLEPGQSYEIPIIPANTPPLKANGKINELGLLGWKNNKQEFSGRIIAGVLNGYAGYEIGTVTIKGHDVYEAFIRVKENGKVSNLQLMSGEDGRQEIESVNSLGEIESINDILLLIANKIALIKERDDLLAQVESLIQENDELVKENSRLRRRVDSLEADVDSLHSSLEGTRKQLDELQNPPAPGPAEPTPAPGDDDDRKGEDEGSGDPGENPGDDSTGGNEGNADGKLNDHSGDTPSGNNGDGTGQENSVLESGEKGIPQPSAGQEGE